MSRESILKAIKGNQPDSLPLPQEIDFYHSNEPLTEQFERVLNFIGGRLYRVKSNAEVVDQLNDLFPGGRWVTTLADFQHHAELLTEQDPHLLENVDVALIKGHFGVAENGAIWVTEDLLGTRVLPFITQQLVVLLEADKLVPLMQQAYDFIGEADYGYAAFIAGPSKTADIEQSLVIGAHGPRGLTVMLLEK